MNNHCHCEPDCKPAAHDCSKCCAKLDLCSMRMESVCDEYQYGPLSIETNCKAAKGAEFRLSSKECEVPFYDCHGERINCIKAEEDFYFRLPKYLDISKIKICVCAEITCKKHADCDCGCCGEDQITKELSDCACICFGKAIVRKKGHDWCCGQRAKYGLYTCCGKLLDTKEACEEAATCFFNLLPGEYCVEELEAPCGYEPCGEKVCFESKCDTEEVVIKGEKKQCRIKVVKFDRCNPDEKLCGAVFKIFDCNKCPVGTITTGGDGTGVSEPLEDGVYELLEIKAPKGYCADCKPVKVTLDRCECESGCETVCIGNLKEIKKGTIKIIKVDGSDFNCRLAGAEFELCDCKGAVVEKLTTDCNGEATTCPLPFGAYTLSEIKAPCSYEADKCELCIQLDRTALSVLVTNRKKQHPKKKCCGCQKETCYKHEKGCDCD